MELDISFSPFALRQRGPCGGHIKVFSLFQALDEDGNFRYANYVVKLSLNDTRNIQKFDFSVTHSLTHTASCS